MGDDKKLKIWKVYLPEGDGDFKTNKFPEEIHSLELKQNVTSISYNFDYKYLLIGCNGKDPNNDK